MDFISNSGCNSNKKNNRLMSNIFEIPIKSEVCLNKTTCYPVKTLLPAWLVISLGILTFLTIRNSIK